jgi:uncharacterized protein (DUF1330 family)
MKNRNAFAMTLVTGIAIGAAAIQGLHAQGAEPAYVVIDISNIKDPEGFKALGPKAGPANDAFGAKTVIRTENIVALDGTAPKRFIVLAFDSAARAKAWHASAAQKEVDVIRMKTTESRQFLVEGTDRGVRK